MKINLVCSVYTVKAHYPANKKALKRHMYLFSVKWDKIKADKNNNEEVSKADNTGINTSLEKGLKRNEWFYYLIFGGEHTFARLGNSAW